jgi:hypothetical protein
MKIVPLGTISWMRKKMDMHGMDIASITITSPQFPISVFILESEGANVRYLIETLLVLPFTPFRK